MTDSNLKNVNKPSMVYHEIVVERHSEDRTYQLVKFSLPDIGRKGRRDAIEELLSRNDAIAAVEWWTKGSIVNKPWEQFYIVLIRRRSASRAT